MDDSNRVSGGGSRKRKRQGVAVAALFGFALLSTGPRALAQAKPAGDVRATVVALDGEDLVIDLGAGQGASEGALVEIWRPVKLRHPVSGKILEDRFRIGTLQLVQVRTTLSLAQPSGELSRVPVAGDLVILPSAASTTSPPAPANPPSGTGGSDAGSAPTGEPPTESTLDADARAVADMFDSLQGTDLVTRIRKY
jgi:hypothetical protein